jgi:2-hydroxy-6-oxonona-2,4-dienedioate hydrolase
VTRTSRSGFGRRTALGGACLVLAATMALVGGTPTPAGAQPEVDPNGALGGLTPRFIDVDGVRTRYYDEGEGEPLLLLHGEGWSGHSSANTWVKNIPDLSQRFRVIAPDKLASGLTGNPLDDRDYNIQGELAHMRAFLRAMELDRVHVVGQSRGGGLAFFLAVEHPDLVRTLVIVNSNTAAPDTGPTDRQRVLAGCPTEPDADEWKCRLRAISHSPDIAFDEEFFRVGAWMASLPKAQETRAKVAAGAGEPLRSGFNEWKKQVHERVRTEGLLRMPVLLYWGLNDPSAMVRNGLALLDVLAESNPHVRMLIANESGHFHYREHPEEFNRNVIGFIEHWAEASAARPPPHGDTRHR